MIAVPPNRLPMDRAIADSYRGMVLLDALVFNTDRHPYNFGVLRDQATGLPLALAPMT